MIRKVLNNKTKSNRIHGATKGKIGTILNIVDKNNNIICVGDKVKYGEYKGIVLFNYHYDEYGIGLDYSLKFDGDKYNIDDYYKFISIPMDNGAKIKLEKLF